MPRIIITFVCAFPIHSEQEQTRKSKEKKPKKEKKKKKKKGEELEEIKQEEPRNDCIYVTSADYFMHIEYNLFPNKTPYIVDVLSWGPVTKVGNGEPINEYALPYRFHLCLTEMFIS